MAAAPTAVGTYRRDLGASLERMFENALDWEHLPHLHASSFSSISCLDAGPWGFRAEVGLHPDDDRILLELLLDREAGRWVSRTVDGTGAGSEIWTTATATGERSCRVDVSFHVPGVPAARRERVARYYVGLYTTLYDEDESMMIGRQQYLDRAFATSAERRCPHRGGPLAEPCDGVITCSWHGYRFDAATGECLDDAKLRLPR